jgi:hypothetical protein
MVHTGESRESCFAAHLQTWPIVPGSGKNTSGHYTKNITDEAYERLLVMLEADGEGGAGTSVTCDTIRQLMRPFIPVSVVITASHVHSMRVRANRIRLQGRTLNTNEKRNFTPIQGWIGLPAKLASIVLMKEALRLLARTKTTTTILQWTTSEMPMTMTMTMATAHLPS